MSTRPPFRPAKPPPLLERTVPVVADARAYGPGAARRDVPAGLTVAALALPAAMAYAEVAGLSPVTGLYALLLPTVAYALLGSSKQLSIGPDGSISALVAAAVLPLAVAGSPDAATLAATLGLLVGAFFAAAWVAKVGWVADYFSRPVLVGYLHGVAIVLVVGQLGKLVGVEVPAAGAVWKFVHTLLELPEASGATVLVSAVALGILLPARFLAPRLPASLIVVIGSIVASWWLGLEGHGVAVVGDVPSGLPSIGLPRPGVSHLLSLLAPAFGIFLVTYVDEVLTARSFAGKHGQQVRVGQELAAMGAANLAAGFSGGFPVGASGSRTAVNDAAGARSQVSGFVACGAVVAVLLFLTGPIAYLPKAVLGAVIVSAAIGLVDPAAWRALWMTDRVELTIAAVTTAGVVVIGVLQALTLAVGLSIVDVVRRSAQPHDAVLGWVDELGRFANVANHRDAVTTPGVVVYRLDDRLFFANANYVKARIGEAVRAAVPPVHWVVFDFEAVTHVDLTGAAALEETRSTLGDEGITLAIARAKRQVRTILDDTGLTASIGSANLYPTIAAAVAACTARSEEPSDEAS
jgi:SulP family sulfate permease